MRLTLRNLATIKDDEWYEGSTEWCDPDMGGDAARWPTPMPLDDLDGNILGQRRRTA
jgi:hypothetical protein